MNEDVTAKKLHPLDEITAKSRHPLEEGDPFLFYCLEGTLNFWSSPTS
jgi:hypothetical protein